MTQNNESVEAVAQHLTMILKRFDADLSPDEENALRAAIAATPREPSSNAHTDLIARDALQAIAVMECYTREGEEPIHLLMMRIAADALQAMTNKA